MRPFLTRSSANTIACGIVNSRLDYYNSLLTGTTLHNLHRLQRVHITLACVVCNAPYRATTKPLLHTLHWLPVHQRMHYKISLITYNTITKQSPSYLYDLFQTLISFRNMCSSNSRKLVLHRCRTTTASRSFRSSAPRIWNNLSPQTKNSTSLKTFKKKF